jgi:psiF repeat-containing protein
MVIERALLKARFVKNRTRTCFVDGAERGVAVAPGLRRRRAFNAYVPTLHFDKVLRRQLDGITNPLALSRGEICVHAVMAPAHGALNSIRWGNIAMKISRILPVAGIVSQLACGAAFSQAPPIPPGAGAGADRQPPGSHWRNPTYAPPAAAQPSAASRDTRAISVSCSQQANAKGLHGKARKAFRSQCRRSGGH